jgi:aconitate hydratase
VEAEERQTYDGNLILASVASAQLSRDEKRASYIVYPPLVVAFALAGRVSIDFETDPIGGLQGQVDDERC